MLNGYDKREFCKFHFAGTSSTSAAEAPLWPPPDSGQVAAATDNEAAQQTRLQ